jgi:hypothetical protein
MAEKKQKVEREKMQWENPFNIFNFPFPLVSKREKIKLKENILSFGNLNLNGESKVVFTPLLYRAAKRNFGN